MCENVIALVQMKSLNSKAYSIKSRLTDSKRKSDLDRTDDQWKQMKSIGTTWTEYVTRTLLAQYLPVRNAYNVLSVVTD